MSNDQPLTSEQIDEMIDALKAQRKALTGRTTKPKKIGVKLSCNLCGEMDTRDNLVRVSKSEYVHSGCVTYQPTELPKTQRKVFMLSLSTETLDLTEQQVKEYLQTMTFCNIRVLSSRVIEQ